MHKSLRRVAALLAALCLAIAPGIPALADGETVLSGEAPAPTIQGGAGYLLETNTDTPLYSYNATKRMYPVSITKVMTALVAIEYTKDFNDIVTFSHAAVNGISWDSSRIGALVGEKLTVEQTLYGLMLKSGNDCAVALAEYVAGSEAAFCELMNKRAAELGCTDTHFVNAHGLHDDNHYTTARDIALIMKAAVSNDIFSTIDSTVSYRVPSTNKHAEGFSWTMGNKMVNPNSSYYYEGTVGGKTGFTDEAWNTLVTYAKRGDSNLICVVLKCAQTHYEDTKLLFDYGFNNFTVYNTDTITDRLSYTMGGTGFFGDLENIVGGNSFTIAATNNYLILPNSVPLKDLQTELIYDEAGTAGADRTFATLRYRHNGMIVGETRLKLVPAAGNGFDFEKHEALEPETETQVVPEENKKFVIDFKMILLGLGIAIAAVVIFVLLKNYFSAKNRKRRLANRRRQQLRNQRLNISSGNQQSSLGHIRTNRRKR